MTLAGFEGVEVGEGEVEEVGGVLESETVLEAEGAEALGEVAFRHEDEAEESAGVVGGELLLELAADGRWGMVEEEERVGVGEEVQREGLLGCTLEHLLKAVRGEEELGETVGDAGGKVPPSYALRATDGR